MKVVSVRTPSVPYLTDVVVYAVTKNGHFLDRSGAQYLISQGQVKINGSRVKQMHFLMPHGMNILEVYGREHPVDIVPAGKE